MVTKKQTEKSIKTTNVVKKPAPTSWAKIHTSTNEEVKKHGI